MRNFLFLTIASFAAAEFEQTFGGGFGQEAKFCPPFRCPKDHEPVPKWPLKLESNGCTSMGGMQIFSAGSASDDDPMAPCCDQRAACQQTCGSMKGFCDDEYLKCSKDVCGAMPDGEQKQKCDSSASINELMVKMDSCQKYDQAQRSQCDCVKSDQVASKRERVLRNFYKKFNPEAVEKVPALAKKVDSSAKMVGLLLKLYKKYPQVIKKVKDPQQAYMEDLMKNAKSEKPKEVIEEDESDAEDLGTEEL